MPFGIPELYKPGQKSTYTPPNYTGASGRLLSGIGGSIKRLAPTTRPMAPAPRPSYNYTPQIGNFGIPTVNAVQSPQTPIGPVAPKPQNYVAPRPGTTPAPASTGYVDAIGRGYQQPPLPPMSPSISSATGQAPVIPSEFPNVGAGPEGPAELIGQEFYDQFSQVDLGAMDPNFGSSMLAGAPTTQGDIAKLLEQNARIREQYLQSFNPTENEQLLQKQLLDLREEANAFGLSVQKGQANELYGGTVKPMELATGRAQQIGVDNSFKAQEYEMRYDNLFQRLGLETSNREAKSKGIKATLDFGQEDVNNLFKAQDLIIKQESLVLDKASKLQDSSRNVLSTILSNFKGLDFEDLPAQAQLQLSQLAVRAGIPIDVLSQGMKVVKDQQMWDNLTKGDDLLYSGLYPGSASGDYDFNASPSSGAGNIPQRHNNPLSIKLGGATSTWVQQGLATLGDKGQDGGNFLKFNDPEVGLQAGADLLFNSGVYTNLTVDAAMRKWSNKGYGGEITPAIARKKVNQLNEAEQTQLLRAMAEREGYFAGQKPVNPLVDAYARQYASTGDIPSGMPKGLFSQVAERARTIEQPPGTVIDVNTGTKPKKLNETQLGGITAARDLLSKLQDAQVSFSQLWTGLAGGVRNKLLRLPGDEAQRYEYLRTEITDLLARARTGAVLNESEIREYGKKLPGSWNQFLGFGTSGKIMLEELYKSIKGKLDTHLQSNGVKVVGYGQRGEEVMQRAAQFDES